MKTIKPLILASASLRRKELLEMIGLKFKVVESKIKEKIDQNLPPHFLSKKLSFEKAKTVYKNHKDSIIIAADTIVICDGKILGKPRDEKEALEMLKFLSNKSHLIITGFTIMSSDLKKPITRSEETKVYMKKITRKEIDSYIKTGEPMGKAGAYAIQGMAQKFIEKIEGDFFNAVGLPIHSLMHELKNLGVKML